ncbi:MAG: ATP-dependent helicase [Schumannella sp.]|nr:ATP-dependent helicase [Schumannella sp.]
MAQPVVLDPGQQAVLDLADGVSAAVIGAPGSGKTTTIVELVADRVLQRGWSPDELLVLTPMRTTATRLRDALSVRLGRATAGPLARSVASFAFEIVTDAARAAGSVAPRLVTGAEQDADIAALLEGQLIDGTGPDWPDDLGPEVRRTARFRSELRELITRTIEFDVTPHRLAQLGSEHGRPQWTAAAAFMAEYLDVVSAARERQLDQAELSRFAVEALASGDPGERAAALRLVIVDDFQEATEATFALLRALGRRGVAVIALGDPDVAANGFRGGETDVLGRLSDVLRIDEVERITLARVHRHGPAIRAVASAVTDRIGAAAAGTQRAAAADDLDDDGIVRLDATTPAREWAGIARELRERHLLHDVPWSQQAVIVRSRVQLDVVRRALAQAEVPVRVVTGGIALRDDPAARALLTLVDVGVERLPLSAETAAELLLGPFGGLDRLGLRRLRLALRAEELAGGGERGADELLIEGLSAPGRFATIDHRVGRSAEALAVTLDELRRASGSIEELLWLAWERSGLARRWYDQAMGSGLAADEANRNLDGIVALFTSAKRFAERRPDEPPATFLADVLDADVPEDVLAPRALSEAVLVATPSATIGLEFDTVVVAGLQEGVWPNMRLRGSLLAPQELVRAVLGIDSADIDERRAIRDDELRLFALAVSRARRRLVFAAVANDDEAVSPFLTMLGDRVSPADPAPRPPLTLRGMVGRLRRTLTDPATPAGERASSAGNLAALAAQQVPGAAPADWHGVAAVSTDARLFADEPVPIRPSSLDTVEKSALDWFLESVARSDPGIAANVGTIMHSALELATSPDPDELWKTVESRWGELLFESEWIEERQKRTMWRFTQALSEYLTDFASSDRRAVAAEQRFELTVGDAVVRGSIDRVELSGDGALVIVDLKTGTPARKQDVPTHPQLAVYQLAYAEHALDEYLLAFGDHRAGGATLLFVKKGANGKKYSEAHQPAFDAAQLDAFRDRVKVAATLVASDSFLGTAEVPGIFDSQAKLRLHRVLAVSSD